MVFSSSLTRSINRQFLFNHYLFCLNCGEGAFVPCDSANSAEVARQGAFSLLHRHCSLPVFLHQTQFFLSCCGSSTPSRPFLAYTEAFDDLDQFIQQDAERRAMRFVIRAKHCCAVTRHQFQSGKGLCFVLPASRCPAGRQFSALLPCPDHKLAPASENPAAKV